MPSIGLRLILAAVGLFSIAPRFTAAELDAPYARSMSAFMRHDLAGAERAAREVVAHDSSASHRLESALMLGAIEWRVRRDTSAASRWLTEAAAMPDGRSRAFAERARMLTTMGRASAAVRAARTALAAATDASQRRTALVQLASAIVEPRVSARLSATAHASPLSDISDLHPLIEQLSAEVRENPGELDPAALLVTLGALANDEPAILLGWNSYYLVGATGATSALLASPRRVLEERLPHWNPQSAEDRTAVAAALADSRFFSAAAVVAMGAPHDARMRDIVAYARFARSVERATDDYYRATALGRGNAKEWKRALDARMRILWRDLAWPAAPPPYVEDSAEAELDRRFGTVINLGSTARYEDLHMGHRVIDERRTSESVRTRGRRARRCAGRDGVEWIPELGVGWTRRARRVGWWREHHAGAAELRARSTARGAKCRTARNSARCERRSNPTASPTSRARAQRRWRTSPGSRAASTCRASRKFSTRCARADCRVPRSRAHSLASTTGRFAKVRSSPTKGVT